MSSYNDLVRRAVLTQPVYEPGKPVEVVAREFGLDPAGIIKLASNENPLGASPKGVAAARAALDDVHLYPDNGAYFLRGDLAGRLGLAPEQFVIGHGSNEIFNLLATAFIEPGREVVMGQHAFISYKLFTLLHGGTPVEVPLGDYTHDLDAMRAAITPDTRLVFLPSPNNPTGTCNTPAEITAFAESLPGHVVFCLDEAYAEYLDDAPDLRPLIAKGRKIICTRTFSKIYGLSGLRIGYGYADPELVGILHRVRAPFNVNAVALAAARAALEDGEFLQRSRAVNAAGLVQLSEGCRALGMEPLPSTGNFLLVRVGDGGACFEYLQKRGVIVRPVAGYGLPGFVRISVGTGEENKRALEELERFAESHAGASAAESQR